jgi:hypothetical protein
MVVQQLNQVDLVEVEVMTQQVDPLEQVMQVVTRHQKEIQVELEEIFHLMQAEAEVVQVPLEQIVLQLLALRVETVLQLVFQEVL